MIQTDPEVYIFALFAVMTTSVMAFVLVTHGFRNSDLQIQSIKIFEAYFIIGVIGWIGLFIKEIAQLQIGLTLSGIFYLICSYLLFIAVVESARNRMASMFSFLIHVVLVVLLIVVSDDVSNILIVSCYVLVAYPLISFMAIRRACRLKNIGHAIIGVGVMVAIGMAPAQIYALVELNNAGLAYGMIVSAGATGYILIGIGFLTSILINEHQLLTSIALHDPLTGLFNRRGLDISIQSILSNSERQQTCVSAIALDIDHFKNVNDTYGHEAGDATLKILAGTLNDIVRGGDIACRFGGEEFVVVLPDTSIEAAVKIAERIRKRIEELSITHGDSTIRITASLGVCSSCISIEIDELLKDADKLLYAAKAEGRNRLCVMQDSRGKLH